MVSAMNALKDKLKTDSLLALKATKGEDAGEARVKLRALRSALAAVAKVETSSKERRTLTDEEVIAVLRKEVAQRQDASGIYAKAGAQERAEGEAQEAAVLESYLPQLLDEAATRELVASIVAETGAEGPKGLGVIMGRLKGRADLDRGLASKIARELLA